MVSVSWTDRMEMVLAGGAGKGSVTGKGGRWGTASRHHGSNSGLGRSALPFLIKSREP